MGIPHFPIHPWLAGPNHLSTWDILIHIFIGIIITLYIISHRIICTHIRGNKEARKQLLLRLTQSTLLPCFSSPGISRLKTATRHFSALVAGLPSAGVARFKASAGMVATLWCDVLLWCGDLFSVWSGCIVWCKGRTELPASIHPCERNRWRGWIGRLYGLRFRLLREGGWRSCLGSCWKPWLWWLGVN